MTILQSGAMGERWNWMRHRLSLASCITCFLFHKSLELWRQSLRAIRNWGRSSCLLHRCHPGQCLPCCLGTWGWLCLPSTHSHRSRLEQQLWLKRQGTWLTLDCFKMLWRSLFFWSILVSNPLMTFWTACSSLATFPTSRRAWKWQRRNWNHHKKGETTTPDSYFGDFLVHVIEVVLFGHFLRFETFQLPHVFVNFAHLLLFRLLGNVQLFLVVINWALPSFHVGCKSSNSITFLAVQRNGVGLLCVFRDFSNSSWFRIRFFWFSNSRRFLARSCWVLQTETEREGKM